MGNSNRSTNGMFFSPADGLSDLPSPGAFSNPGQPSVFPDVSMTDKSGDAAVGTKPAESFAGMSADTSPGMSTPVSLAEVPETPAANLGPELGGDLNVIPRPSGSY